MAEPEDESSLTGGGAPPDDIKEGTSMSIGSQLGKRRRPVNENNDDGKESREARSRAAHDGPRRLRAPSKPR